VNANALLIDPRDDVVTALQSVPAGGAVCWGSSDPVSAREEVPVGHKVAIRPLAAGAVVRKYGYAIGRAAEAIAAGDRVHTHNLSALEIRK
jgi:hypothetical protein